MKRATRAWDSEIRQRWLRSWTDRHGPVEEAEPAPAARRIGNRFPPPHFSTNRVDSRGLRRTPVDSTAADKRLHSNVLNRKLRIVSHLPKYRSNGFDSRCFQGSVRLSAGRRAGPHARGSTGTSCAAVRLSCASVRPPRVRVAARRAIIVR